MIGRFLDGLRFRREHRWSQEHLSELLDSELDGAERERLHDHLGICPQCRRVLATLRRTIESLRSLGSSGARPREATADGTIAAGVIERLRGEP